MLKKLSTFALATALSWSLSAHSAFAQSPSVSESKSGEAERLIASRDTAREVRQNDKLKSDVGKLVSDTKAGKLKLADSGSQSGKKHGLSTGAKIGIGVGIGIAVLAILVLHARAHMFDDFRPFSNGGSISF